MINTTCPKCNAPHAKKLKLIYEDGVTSINQQSISSTKTNIIINPKIKTNAITSGENVSKLAESVAPPSEPNLNYLIPKNPILAPLLIMILSIIYGIFGEKFMYVILSPFIGAIALVVFSTIKSMTDDGKMEEAIAKKKMEERTLEYKKKLEKWENTFMCMQCGEKFIPE